MHRLVKIVPADTGQTPGQAELAGAYKLSIMMYSDDTYPYYAYNYFFNNDASVCEQ